MSMIGQTAIDAVFQTFGVDAVLTPIAGLPQTIRVLPKADNEVIDFGDSRILSDTLVLEVRCSEATPLKGDLVNFRGVDYLIQSKPQRQDADQLVWVLDMRKA